MSGRPSNALLIGIGVLAAIAVVLTFTIGMRGGKSEASARGYAYKLGFRCAERSMSAAGVGTRSTGQVNVTELKAACARHARVLGVVDARAFAQGVDGFFRSSHPTP